MKITVLGATGSIGSPTAFYLAAQGLADEIVMVTGKRQNVLQQLEMDIGTAAASQDVNIIAGSYEDLPGSDIIINTAAPHPKEIIKDRREMLRSNIPLIKTISEKIAHHCPDAIVINVNNPIEPLNYVTYRAGKFPSSKVIGYSFNDTFRFKELLAAAFNVKASQAEGMVIGEHGSTQVLLFSTARIDGKPLSVDQATKAQIKGEIPKIFKKLEALKAGRTAGYSCAVGIATIVRAIKNDTGEVLPCSAMLNGQYGYSGLSMTVPAVIGKEGIREILEYEIAPDEAQELEVSARTLAESIEIVDQELGTA